MFANAVKNGPTFTASGRRGTANVLDEVEVTGLDRGRRVVRVGGDQVHVQLEGVGAGVLYQFRVPDPAAGRRAVERADDRDIELALRVLEVSKVLVRTRQACVGRRVRAAVERPVRR